MLITTDKRGVESLRMSKLEQNRLASINILSIEIQNAKASGMSEEDLREKNAELANQRRLFSELIS